MITARAGGAVRAFEAGVVGGPRCHDVLAFGEVRAGRAEIAIGIESLADVGQSLRGLFARAVAAAGVDPHDVLVVRLNEGGVEVDVIDFDDPRWPVRTAHVAAAHLAEGAGTISAARRLVSSEG